ncbi:MAG: metalloregulator ArsR/SmtB family transcription factor [Micrococcaceae bacterium]
MEQEINVTNILKSLADDTRLDIIRKLARDKDEVTSSEIVIGCGNALNLSQPTMSHHFNKLVTAQVVVERKQGVTKYYRLNHKLLASIGIDATKL